MVSVCEDSVYQLEDGYWAYRFSIVVDVRRISRKKRAAEQGKNMILTRFCFYDLYTFPFA